MADRLIVKGCGNLDGEFEFDFVELLSPSGFTVAEYRRIKQFAGIRRGEIVDAFENDDVELEIVLVAIILARHGKTTASEERVIAAIDKDRDSILWHWENREEAEADPPASPAETPEQAQSTDGGDTSTASSESSENGRSRTGTPA